MKTQPYICRIHIENFRNFHSADFNLSDKQVLIGENAVGKSNLLVALQLILDPTLSEKDRMLDETDFWEGLPTPTESNDQIFIEIYFKNYEDNQNLLAQLADATVMLEGEEALKLTYKFYKKDETSTDFTYVIYKGDDETRVFTYEDRKMLNIRVIKAIRDVESEMRNSRTSPLTQIIKQKYTISKDVLVEISKALEDKGADTLHIGQVENLESKIQALINSMVSFSADEFNVSLKTMNIDATKLLHSLRPLINNRESGNTSLGVNNILYIALILLLIEDDTIKNYLSGDLYRELIEKDEHGYIGYCYISHGAADEYFLDYNALEEPGVFVGLYSFLSDAIPSYHGTTILAIEEPEAHLHPIYQRLLYKYVMNKTNTSVIITTHSTHISSVAPITSLVHLITTPDGTDIKTTAALILSEKEKADLSRYIDVKCGELYTAKGIIFVEGIAEEYLVASFAEAIEIELDRIGVVICNINSTVFKPYCRLADALGIPYVVITDGDYYHYAKGKKCFGDMATDNDFTIGFDGLDRLKRMCEGRINRLYGERFDEFDFIKQRSIFEELGMYVGEYTLEIDIFNAANIADKGIISKVFGDLTSGGEQHKQNFSKNLMSGDYYKCLSQIESSHSGIGKGRFAQRLAGEVAPTMIPDYVSRAIKAIARKVHW